ncbi:uncharacterized protein [Antedon mediterranea]|uniref:uncharacterized protein n=1 Tax=Antedon mediterranea TaxID=105859 RepID=UPI003AF6B448
MLLKLIKHELDVKYVPGKYMYIADALSRAYPDKVDRDAQPLEQLKYRVHSLDEIGLLPMSKARIVEAIRATRADVVLQTLILTCKNGWPKHRWGAPEQIRQYWHLRDEIHEIDGLVFLGEKLIVPSQMRADMLNKIHESHLGMEKCKARARSIMY